LNEFDFSKISLSLERDLAPAENPIDAYRDIKALLERTVNLGNYESMRVGLGESFDIGCV